MDSGKSRMEETEDALQSPHIQVPAIPSPATAQVTHQRFSIFLHSQLLLFHGIPRWDRLSRNCNLVGTTPSIRNWPIQVSVKIYNQIINWYHRRSGPRLAPFLPRSAKSILDKITVTAPLSPARAYQHPSFLSGPPPIPTSPGTCSSTFLVDGTAIIDPGSTRVNPH
ncbi:hypothetical protein L211DRAFT_177553 [Terfezia boudieri ATCC MYA-4762]|uniref:Uncharacterized protein n=1 Tax=Terfezia boudieri ATCC MYA-4762 TaxID=1051890 RepID=A0A3N4LNX7_9PEZI|nr:hypothetical protein L211DRAFT_177553 [Terfezia boudieri ATCC MYA-4762]